MAYNTKNIINDASGKPVPQIYNPYTDQYEVVQGADGGTNSVKSFVFQTAGTTVTGNGLVFTHYGFKTMTIEITGSSTSFTVVFEVAGESGSFVSINAFNKSTNIISNQATSLGIYEISIVGVASIRARISAIGNGNLMIQGRAVS